MARLFKVQTTDRIVNQLQDNIAKLLEPTATTVQDSPLLAGKILEKVDLTSGPNTIRHTLGRPLKGWFIVRRRASATVYDTQDSNDTPQVTLLLTASANVTVDLYVF